MKFIPSAVAAIFQVIGSSLVVFYSFRLMRMGEELEPHETVSTTVAQGEIGAVHPQFQLAHP